MLYIIYNEKSIIRKVLFCILRWCPYFKNIHCITNTRANTGMRYTNTNTNANTNPDNGFRLIFKNKYLFATWGISQFLIRFCKILYSYSGMQKKNAMYIQKHPKIQIQMQIQGHFRNNLMEVKDFIVPSLRSYLRIIGKYTQHTRIQHYTHYFSGPSGYKTK